MNAATTLIGELPEEEQQRVDAEEAYRRFLARLSHQSVVKHYDAYADIPWDDPAYAVDPDDPRFTLSEDDPLGATAWYRSQPPAIRARIGLHMIANFAMAFARHFLRRNVPHVHGVKLLLLRLRTAVVMKIASMFMTRPSAHIVRTYAIPSAVLGEAYGPGSRAAEHVKRALFKPRELCWELGVLNVRWAWLWRRLRIYAPQGSPV